MTFTLDTQITPSQKENTEKKEVENSFVIRKYLKGNMFDFKPPSFKYKICLECSQYKNKKKIACLGQWRLNQPEPVQTLISLSLFKTNCNILFGNIHKLSHCSLLNLKNCQIDTPSVPK